MTEYTINLTASDESALKRAASAAGMNEVEFVEKLISDHFASGAPPEWHGDLLLKVLSDLRVTPASELDSNLLEHGWLKLHGATALGSLPAGLKDLLSKGLLIQVGNNYRLSSNGYEFVK